MNELSNNINSREIGSSLNNRFDLMIKNRINYHPDIIDYLWIGTEKEYEETFIDNRRYSYEPSFININLPVEVIYDLDSVEKLNY